LSESLGLSLEPFNLPLLLGELFLVLLVLFFELRDLNGLPIVALLEFSDQLISLQEKSCEEAD
jgi:hypothetical protein